MLEELPHPDDIPINGKLRCEKYTWPHDKLVEAAEEILAASGAYTWHHWEEEAASRARPQQPKFKQRRKWFMCPGRDGK